MITNNKEIHNNIRLYSYNFSYNSKKDYYKQSLYKADTNFIQTYNKSITNPDKSITNLRFVRICRAMTSLAVILPARSQFVTKKQGHSLLEQPSKVKICYRFGTSLYKPKVYHPFSGRRDALKTVERAKITKNIEKSKVKGILGKIYISSTKNNTIITLIDRENNTKGWSSSGSLGFKNARKSTTYAAQAAAENIVKKAKLLGYTHLRIIIKGLGRSKQATLRAITKSFSKIISIEDRTAIPFNGCRLSKKRRV